MALLREAVPQTGLVSEAQGKQLFVALQEIGDGARSDGDVQVLEDLVDLRDTAMLAVAQGADTGNHIEAELAMRQGPATFFLRTIGQMVTRTGRVGAAQDRHAEARDILKGGDSALGLVEVPQAAAASSTLLAQREQAHRAGNRRAFGTAGYDDPPQLKHLLSFALS